MEDALVHLVNGDVEGLEEQGLNPCFNGRCTRTERELLEKMRNYKS